MKDLTSIYVILFLIVILLISSFNKLFSPNYKKRKHNLNVSTGNRTIMKLKGFDGDFKSQKILTYLRKINPYVFEELVLSALSKKGYKIKRNDSYSGDGGFDGILIHKNRIYLIQAKRYSKMVNSSHIKDFAKLILSKKAAGGYFIHTGKTAPNSYAIYKSSNIKIISGQQLIDLILFQPGVDQDQNVQF